MMSRTCSIYGRHEERLQNVGWET